MRQTLEKRLLLLAMIIWLVSGLCIVCASAQSKPGNTQALVPKVEAKESKKEADADFGPYMADLERDIKSQWFAPKGKESKRVVVVFKVHKDGKVSDARIGKTSGVAAEDLAALKAVHNAGPFRKLPAGAPDDVDIEFTFDHNVFKDLDTEKALGQEPPRRVSLTNQPAEDELRPAEDPGPTSWFDIGSRLPGIALGVVVVSIATGLLRLASRRSGAKFLLFFGAICFAVVFAILGTQEILRVWSGETQSGPEQDAGSQSGILASAIDINRRDNSILFNMHVVDKLDYADARDTEGNPIKHSLTTVSGEGGGYKIEGKLVDGAALIALKLIRGKQIVLDKKLPRWAGLCEPSYQVIDPLSDSDYSQQPIARDINNDGLPELILTKNDNWGHAPDECSIFQLDGGDRLKEIYHATLQSPSFQDLDNNGTYEIIVDDRTFREWRDTANCAIPNQPIILAFDGGTYKPSRRLMWKEAPSQDELDRTMDKLQKNIDTYRGVCKPGTRAMTPMVWIELVELIYSNNASTAKTILNYLYPGKTKLVVTTWPPDHGIDSAAVETREEFWLSLIKQAKTSKYAPALFSDL